MSPRIRIVPFASAVAEIHPDKVVTTFREDGSRTEFWPPVEKPDFQAAAREMGYLDVMRYGIEHDLTHHFIADAMLWPHSWSIWSQAHGTHKPGATWSQRVADEEHLVNRMQRYINTGEVDADFGVLVCTFGEHLPQVANNLLKVLRPWLFPAQEIRHGAQREAPDG